MKFFQYITVQNTVSNESMFHMLHSVPSIGWYPKLKYWDCISPRTLHLSATLTSVIQDKQQASRSHGGTFHFAFPCLTDLQRGHSRCKLQDFIPHWEGRGGMSDLQRSMTGPYQGFGTGTLQSHLEYWLYHFYPGSEEQREAKVGISRVAHTRRHKMNRMRGAGAEALSCWDRWVDMWYFFFLLLLNMQTERRPWRLDSLSASSHSAKSTFCLEAGMSLASVLSLQAGVDVRLRKLTR